MTSAGSPTPCDGPGAEGIRHLRKVAVVTGSRADYDLLFGMMSLIGRDPDFDLHVIVTGMHLMERFGRTVEAIRGDGIPIAAEVDLGLEGDSPADMARACGRGVERLADALARVRPDIVVVLGDRFEILAASLAALLLGLPLAHIHGGEVTEGAVDDSMRHAITKMAHLHFAAAEPYARRIVQMGEAPDRVFTVGAPGCDNIRATNLLDRPSLGRALGMELAGPYIVVTYHPVTRQPADDRAAVEALLEVLQAQAGLSVIFTGVNADPGHGVIESLISSYVSRHASRARLFSSLGRVRYLSAVKHAAAVVGNSSSGLIEAPALGVPTVNIGSRQAGRLRARSVIDCPPGREAIAAALGRALSAEFRNAITGQELPYGDGRAAERLVASLKAVDADSLAAKPFHDLAPA